MSFPFVLARGSSFSTGACHARLAWISLSTAFVGWGETILVGGWMDRVRDLGLCLMLFNADLAVEFCGLILTTHSRQSITCFSVSARRAIINKACSLRWSERST